MNKTKKIALAAVSVVMAGSMAFGMFGCTPKDDDDEPTIGGKQTKYTVAGADASIADVTLNINIGDANTRSISFAYGELLSGSVTLPDGKTYTSSSLKPAWAAFQTMVGCKFNDVWQNASNKLKTAVESTTSSGKLSAMDIITDGASSVSTYSDKLLDLSNYLDEMPNYKAFLDANPIVRLSLTSDATTGAMYYAPYFDGNNDIEKYELFKINWVEALLDSADGAGDTETTFASHAAVKAAKGGDYAGVVGTSASIQSFMGTTGSWNTDVLDKDGEKLAGGITVDYSKALDAAKSATAPLGVAYAAAAGEAYTGDSGNIVDIMNAAIDAKSGDVTGQQLLTILKEYIKVAYYVGTTDTAFYTQTGYKLSDVFAGYSAAWDVDLYAALGRVLVTNPTLLLSGDKGNTIGGTGATSLADLYLLCARQNNMQRMIDTVSMIGQLYGVRGLESKNLYSYIDSNGNLQDARENYASYDAMEKFNAFWQEGLVYTGASGSNGDQSYYKSGTPEALSTYDYVNTQTPVGFQVQGDVTGKFSGVEATYNYTPIITPVSQWNDGEAKYMRFTESWRTTKDTGFCIPVDNVKDDPVKLKAVLTFIDKMFSNDGQILLTYGPKASSATANDGFWYNAPATDAQIAAGTYFEYEGVKLYSTVKYSEGYQPTITDQVMQAYYGENAVNGYFFTGTGVKYLGETHTIGSATAYDKGADLPAGTQCIKADGTYEDIATAPAASLYVVDGKLCNKNGVEVNNSGSPIIDKTVSQWTTDATLNYTNFARYVIGSALPIGNKLQSFEFQLTSDMGRVGALIVDKAMSESVVFHTENKMTENPWYIAVPTLLPYTDGQQTELDSTHKNVYTNAQGTYFTNNKNDTTNLYWQIIKYGYNTAKINAGVSTYTPLNLATPTTSAQNIVTALNAVDGLNTYVGIKQSAWNKDKVLINSLTANA